MKNSPQPQSSPITGWSVGILGYGNQGRAQALNLRDAGFDVIVGARPRGRSEWSAREERFETSSPEDLTQRCDIVALLTPDETHGTLLASMASGEKARVVVLAHGFTLQFDEPPLRPDWDVVLVAPSGPGSSLRMPDGPGRIPAVIAVHQDSSGEARARARAYAVAAGCSEESLLDASVAEEVEIDLFGEQVVLCGGLAALVTAAFETLVAEGYDPRLAYLECVHQIGRTADMVTRYGVSGMRERISRVALFGDLTRGERTIGPKIRERMAEILSEIRSRNFADEWSAEVAAGYPRSREGLDRSRRHPMESAGRGFRGDQKNAPPP